MQAEVRALKQEAVCYDSIRVRRERSDWVGGKVLDAQSIECLLEAPRFVPEAISSHRRL